MKIIAHRGASFTAPENTLAAFRLGLEQGADGIELDVRLTADGQIIALHDDDTERTTGVCHRAVDADYSIICTLDAGSWKCDDFKCEKIPLLREVLDILPAGKEIYIEIKCGSEIINPLTELFKQYHGLNQSAVIFGFDYETMKNIREALPDFRTLWICEFGCNLPVSEGMYEAAEKMVRDGGFGGFSTKNDRKHCAEMRKRLSDLIFNVWTVDNPDDARFYKSLGISTLTTNRPDIMLNI